MATKATKKPTKKQKKAERVDPVKAFNRASKLFNKGSHEEALAILVKLDVDEEVAVLRGQVRKALGDSANAMKDFDRALALAPTSRDALNERAVLHLANGDLTRAEADLRLAVAEDFLPSQKSPEFALLHCSLAEVLAAKGDVDGALTALERAVHLDKTWQTEAPKLDTLKSLRKDPRWKPIVAGKYVFWLHGKVLSRLDHRDAKIGETTIPTKIGKHVIPPPIRQLLSFDFPRTGYGKYQLMLGFADAPQHDEPKELGMDRPWVIWGRGPAPYYTIVAIALDDAKPEDPEIHVLRFGARTFRKKERASTWLYQGLLSNR